MDSIEDLIPCVSGTVIAMIFFGKKNSTLESFKTVPILPLLRNMRKDPLKEFSVTSLKNPCETNEGFVLYIKFCLVYSLLASDLIILTDDEITRLVPRLTFRCLNIYFIQSTLVVLHFKYDQARRRFVEWAQNEIAVVPDFHKRILFSDERTSG
ncbi:hypothetical protein TNCV_1478361 [Trichonephila clavipes]|nr:hypothetical protein TNCV_1478361 [Trichonephila clavipes]